MSFLTLSGVHGTEVSSSLSTYNHRGSESGPVVVPLSSRLRVSGNKETMVTCGCFGLLSSLVSVLVSLSRFLYVSLFSLVLHRNSVKVTTVCWTQRRRLLRCLSKIKLYIYFTLTSFNYSWGSSVRVEPLDCSRKG